MVLSPAGACLGTAIPAPSLQDASPASPRRLTCPAPRTHLSLLFTNTAGGQRPPLPSAACPRRAPRSGASLHVLKVLAARRARASASSCCVVVAEQGAEGARRRRCLVIWRHHLSAAPPAGRPGTRREAGRGRGRHACGDVTIFIPRVGVGTPGGK